MRRRTFLKTTAAAAAAAATGPIILGAEDKAGTDNPTIGVEGHKYQCFHNWGELPKDYSWQTTHNVALDAEGNVYITHQGVGKQMDVVLVFDSKGKFIRSFGKEFHGGGHGIEIRMEGKDEFIYLSNTWTKELKLMKTTLKGEVVWKMGRPECKEYEDPKKAYNPTNICFTPDGGFIVGDGYGSAFMLIYDKDAKLKKVFGGAGKELGKLATPHGQWIDDRVKDKPILIVCDRANHRLQSFDLEGKALDASEFDKVVLFPAHAKVKGKVLLVPDLYARVSLFGDYAKDMKPIVHLGDDAEWLKKVQKDGIRTKPKEWVAGKFVHPHDAAFDKDGNIFVVEWVSTGRVTFLKKVG
jgi:hypothetical protein